MDKEYEALISGYRRMFLLLDSIHFNSQNTADIYSRYIDVPKESAVVPITHCGIRDQRCLRSFDGQILRLGFVGSEAPYKGLPMLKGVLARLNNEGYSERVRLNVFGGRTGADSELPNVKYSGRFSSSQTSSVYNSIDVLVVPSIWYETFSLTTLEALQFGAPVIVSDKVGAKDIVKQYEFGFVYSTEDDLFRILHSIILDRSPLIAINEHIVKSPWRWSMENHARDIEKKIYKYE